MVEPVVAVVGYSKIQHHVGVGLVAEEPVVEEAMISQANGILTSLLVCGLQEAAVAVAWAVAWAAV